jgi:hypothetical protein
MEAGSSVDQFKSNLFMEAGSSVDQFKSNLFMEAGLINWIWISVSLNSIMVQIMFGAMLT